ncbi:hypothetical protein BXOR1_14760 [Xanthomonas oryzae pv. oryzicola]|nr:hypothetical protein BE73_22615 [Xanthomonas oryzae pv. oryzicola]KOR49365.1 hypothetical protein ADT27_04915 [Xanthomonas oryzae]AKK62602.1 hypothetical protein FE36_01195 [Xanthomonas oryzae pv. oryzicola]AKN94867.1 hypothetical protein ACU13_19490 [Xanthomonas oryzae pv. oryzicola]AKN98592.1 hypothetical protein ACU10_19410 [Xanthomonas oryzae pv. oryzicola]
MCAAYVARRLLRPALMVVQHRWLPLAPRVVTALARAHRLRVTAAVTAFGPQADRSPSPHVFAARLR